MSEKPPAPPIEPQQWMGGVTVVDIGDLRVARGLSRRPYSVCKHRNLSYDTNERRIWCNDCKCDVEAFDAFKLLVENHDEAWRRIHKRQTEIAEAEAHSLISLAAKNLDKSWRQRSLSPCCPHCNGVLLPEDFSKGIGTRYNSDMERQRRKAKAAKDSP